MKEVTINTPLTHKGKTLTLREWAQKKGISPQALKHRITGLKWGLTKALETPPADYTNSKDVAQRQLDELKVERLPPLLKLALIRDGYEGNHCGRRLRQYHPKLFNQWYEVEFKKNPVIE